ncbi:MAG: bile acid:sodium symporter [Rikenella sp.]|nr:bile acid:sodium symporter [Rikenella sp.]
MVARWKRYGLDPFILALFGAIFLAWAAPSWGAEHERWSPAEVAGWGVGVIFFFYGLRLNGEKLRVGLQNIRLHTVVQLTTFLLFPLLVLGVMLCVDLQADYYLWLGIFFAATLPSTVSSSVVMVALAGGNVPAAIFNASVSSLAGIFLTPLWMSLFLKAEAGANSLRDVVVGLVFQVLVPVGAGMLLHRWWGGFAERNRRWLSRFDQTVIVAIVYTSFCESFAERRFAAVSWPQLVGLAAGMTALFFVVYGIVSVVCRRLHFNREDRITALFCGSKKSLVHGTVMSKVLVADQTLTGILLLPIMIYHAMQLIVVGIIARRMGESVRK